MIHILENIEYICTYKKSNWKATIKDIWCYDENYIEFTVRGRGSRIKAYFGKGQNEYWICFPELNKGCGLADPGDHFWNLEKLSDLFDNIIDATTVVEGIENLRVNLYLRWDYSI